jgi:predicted dehydrogenase
MNKHPLNLGFIGGGLGSIAGNTHYAAATMDGIYRLQTGAFSTDPKTNQETADVWHIDSPYDSWRTMIDEEIQQLDVCVILTPTPTHAPIVKELLKRKIPIICEKAFVSSLSEANELKDIYDPSEHFLSVTYNYTGYPLIRELRERILNNELGEIINIRLEMPQESFLRPPVSQKYPQAWRLRDDYIPTICLDLGVHIQHMASFLTGMDPDRVMAKMDTFSHYNVVDNVDVFTGYPSGATGHLWMSKTAIGHRNGLAVHIYGTKASAHWIQTQPEQLQLHYSSGEKKIVERGGDTLLCGQKRYNRMTPGHPAGFIEAFANLYVDIADDFKNFKHGLVPNNPYTFSIEDAYKGLHLFHKAKESHENGQWISL